eukprot:scaffold2243_cov122-Cylindrotheca_fusiformis.AAC.3
MIDGGNGEVRSAATIIPVRRRGGSFGNKSTEFGGSANPSSSSSTVLLATEGLVPTKRIHPDDGKCYSVI